MARKRGPDPVTAGLAALRGPLPMKPPNARTLAAIRANPACNARRVLDAAGVDKASLALQLGRPVSRAAGLELYAAAADLPGAAVDADPRPTAPAAAAVGAARAGRQAAA